MPDELGHEWRVLHPFEIPGVRFPTDNTPPNQRRLAENDALVELIQTTEYLKDTPTWGQRDYRLHPLRYGDPFYRGGGRDRGRGRRDWLSERPFERETNGGSGRGFFHGNGRGAVREAHQTTSKSEQRDRQEEDWSIVASIERRDDSPVRQVSQRTPPTPHPSDERLFTNWSSLESPCARTSPQSVPIRETGQSINQPDNQTTQPGSEPAQVGATGNALSDNVSSPRACQQPDEVGVRIMDMGTNTSDVEARPHRDGTRVVTLDANIQTPLLIVDIMIPTGGEDQIALPQINLSISGYQPNSLRDSQLGSSDVRAQEISVLPQVDRLVSAPTRGNIRGRILESARIMEWEYSQDGTYLPETSVLHAEGNIWEIVAMIIDPTEVRDPLKEEGIQIRMGDCLIEGDILIGIEDLLEEEDILEEDPLMVEDP